jgi:perosamine synthetase
LTLTSRSATTDMTAIMDIARWHKLIVIEDACQAHGAAFEGRPVGGFGIGCFSFYPTKNMTTGEGGIITTNDGGLAERLRRLRNHGQSQHYRHDSLGYHFRSTDLHAAIGLAQLKKLPAWNERRASNAGYLNDRLQDVYTPTTRPNRRHVFHQYTIRVSGDRQAFQDHLQKHNIGTAIHYPIPIHHQAVYQSRGYNDVLPEAEAAAHQVLSLPIHPALSRADLDRIIEAVNSLARMS